MAGIPFSVNWDYRCPFARNAHEHLVVALEAGAPFEAAFVPFSLDQAHAEDADTPVWEDPEREADLLAAQVGIVVRDRFPEQFLRAHLALFALRHDEGGDLRDQAALASVLQRKGVDASRVFEEISSGWPLEEFRRSHQAAVADHAVFGVPTFVAGGEAAFVRIMTRPGNDAALATATIERILDLLLHHVELNEFKHTSIPN
jgi:predicted DsbA family dithiol-disulfide isomerase